MSKEKLSKEQKKAAKAEKKAEKKAKGSNPEVSSALIQGVAALLCVGIIAFGANSITDKVNKNNLEIAGGGTAASDQAQQADGTVAPADDAAADDTAAPADDTVSDIKDDVAADDSSYVDDTTDDDSSSPAPVVNQDTPKNDADKKTQTPAKKDLSAAEILNIYNSATKKAADKKVGFTKSRNTIEKKYEAGLTLDASKDIVFRFMGVGDKYKFSKTVTSADADSYSKYFLASSLTQADLAAAPVCKDNGNSYTITLKLKDGSSSVTDGKVTLDAKTPLNKSGIANGADDKDYWDHKTAQNIYAAIDDVPGCKSATIKERYSNAVVVMNVTKDGKIISMKADFFFHVDIDKVLGSSGVAEAQTSLTMSNFKW